MAAAGSARGLYFLAATGVLLLDQWSKWVVEQALAPGELRRIIGGFFNLTHVRNRGAAFGLFSDSESAAVQVFLVVFSLLALGLVVALLWRGAAAGMAGWGLALIFGGALGNLLDRLRTGSVVDFLDFYVGSYHWPAFNAADSSIVLGAGLLLLQVLRRRAPAPQAEAHEV